MTNEEMLYEFCEILEMELDISDKNNYKHKVSYKSTIEMTDVMGGETLVSRVLIDDVPVFRVMRRIIKNEDGIIGREESAWMILKNAFALGAMEAKRQIDNIK